MKNDVLFIHCAGPQGVQEGSTFLHSYLKEALGSNYSLVVPEMPDPEAPHYKPWKKKLKQSLQRVNDGVIVIGHSLGASVVLKYFAEKNPKKSVAGLFLVSAVYWGKEDWKVEEYTLDDYLFNALTTIPHIYFYHSKDDEVVPVSHLWYFASAIPEAKIREFDNSGHLFGSGLPQLVDDIKSMTSNGRSI